MTSQPTSRDELINEIVNRYISGQSIRDVAAAIQRSYGLVRGILADAGVSMRAPGGRRTGTSTTVADDVERGAAMAVHPSAGMPKPKKNKIKQAKQEKGGHKAMADKESEKKAKEDKPVEAKPKDKKKSGDKKSKKKCCDKKKCCCKKAEKKSGGKKSKKKGKHGKKK